MDNWAIIKLTIWHCLCALSVSGCFALTEYCIRLMYPNGAVLWWVDKIEFALVIIVTTGLAVMFVSTFGRIVLSAVREAWKDFANGKGQIVLA